MRFLVKLFSLISGLIFPPQCCLCKKVLKQPADLCNPCHKKLPWNTTSCKKCALPSSINMDYCGNCLRQPPQFTQNISHSISPFRYEPPISTWILQLKFHHQLRYAGIIGRQLAKTLMDSPHSLPQCIIPVPLHNRRLRHRGFNQAIEIAKIVAKLLKIPLLTHSVTRIIYTQPQSKLKALQRRHNLENAFKICSPIPFQHVAILDDVMTTGETARALSQCLSDHGIKKIEIWSCARA